MKTEYKKGDRVRLVSVEDWHEQLGARVGMVGTVLEDSSVPFVEIDGWKNTNKVYTENLAFGYRCLELVKQVAFKNGDRVRVVSENGMQAEHKGTLDMCGTVVDDCASFPAVELDDGSIRDYAAERLELVKEDAPTFAAGDRVEYVGGYFADCDRELSPDLIGKRGAVVAQTSDTNVKITWDVPGGCTGVFPQNLRKLEPWEVAMESGEFYFKHYQNTRNDYHAKKQGGDWIVSWDDGITFFADGTAVECLRKGWWLLMDKPSETSKPDPVAEAAAAYKAAVAAYEAATEAARSANEAAREAGNRAHDLWMAQNAALERLTKAAAA